MEERFAPNFLQSSCRLENSSAAGRATSTRGAFESSAVKIMVPSGPAPSVPLKENRTFSVAFALGVMMKISSEIATTCRPPVHECRNPAPSPSLKFLQPIRNVASEPTTPRWVSDARQSADVAVVLTKKQRQIRRKDHKSRSGKFLRSCKLSLVVGSREPLIRRPWVLIAIAI
jgi:hypothetical protein